MNIFVPTSEFFQLHIFASELIYRNPHVTAFGFFNVDFGLLYCVSIVLILSWEEDLNTQNLNADL